MAGAAVPHDLIVQILPNLPVKSLLRFSCASKTWYSTISHPQFSRSFLHGRRRPSLLISDNVKEFSSIPIESLLGGEDNVRTSHSPLPWEAPFDYNNGCSSRNIILGSSNGLVCVEHETYRGDRLERCGLLLWNPSTRKFRLLPYPGCYSDSFRDGSSTYAWFGFDESKDDYKLVLLNCTDFSRGFPRPPVTPELHVFTLKGNTWRRAPIDHLALGHIREFCGKKCNANRESIGVLCNGAIHWVETCRRFYILALDLATEKFRPMEIEFYHPRQTKKLFPWVGSLFGGCLCLSSLVEEDGCHVANVWMMKEYGVESSWTKVSSIIMSDVLTNYPRVLKFYPILLSNEGEEIVVMYRNWREREVKIVKMRVDGARKVWLEETPLCVSSEDCHVVVLHMEESMVSVY